MELEEFKQRFQTLKAQGFVKSLRKGPTGIGYTLETLLGLKENNLALPDINGVEVKAHREHANNMITLFTFNQKAWRLKPLEAIGSH